LIERKREAHGNLVQNWRIRLIGDRVGLGRNAKFVGEIADSLGEIARNRSCRPPKAFANRFNRPTGWKCVVKWQSLPQFMVFPQEADCHLKLRLVLTNISLAACNVETIARHLLPPAHSRVARITKRASPFATSLILIGD
jgi:hypothetical protein